MLNFYKKSLFFIITAVVFCGIFLLLTSQIKSNPVIAAPPIPGTCADSCGATCGYTGGPACTWGVLKKCCESNPSKCASLVYWDGKIGNCASEIDPTYQTFSDCEDCGGGEEVCVYSYEQSYQASPSECGGVCRCTNAGEGGGSGGGSGASCDISNCPSGTASASCSDSCSETLGYYSVSSDVCSGGYCYCCGSGGLSPSCTVAYCQAQYPLTALVLCGVDGGGVAACGVDRAYYGQRASSDCSLSSQYCTCCGALGTRPLNCSLSANTSCGINGSLNPLFTILAEGSDITSWQLNFDDGSAPSSGAGNPNGQTMSHLYSSSGSFVPYLTIYNSSGGSKSCGTDIAVVQQPNNLQHTANTPLSISWSWIGSPGATSYPVYYSAYGNTLFAFNPLIELSPKGWLFKKSEIVTNHIQTQSNFLNLAFADFGSVGVGQWNVPTRIGVKSCIGSCCSAMRESAEVYTSIESPNIINCSDILPNSFTVSVSSNENPANNGFSYLGQKNSGIKISVKKASDGSGPPETGWLQGVGIFSAPTSQNFAGLQANTEYTVCAQSRNQDGNLAGAGDIRENCISCFTGSPPPSFGHVRVYGAGGALIKLNLILVSTAETNGHGVLKINTPQGTTLAADLVATSDANASPVRVVTPFGIRAWKKAP